MKEYGVIVLPFQVVLTGMILKVFYKKIEMTTYLLIAASLLVDAFAIVNEALFPLSSFLIMVSLLRYYGRDWWSVVYAFAFNFLMYVIYSNIPMGSYFVTAVNYYISYTLMQTMTKNEIYIKNVLYYASVKHLAIAAGYWLVRVEKFNYIADALSVVVAYYMVRASIYYYGQINGKKH